MKIEMLNKSATTVAYIIGLSKNNKLEIAYFLLLSFYFTYCASNHINRPDLASGIAIATFFYVIIKSISKLSRLIFTSLLTIFMFIWILSTAYMHKFNSMPIEAGVAFAQTNFSEMASYIKSVVPTYGLIIGMSTIIILPLSLFLGKINYSINKNKITALTIIIISVVIIQGNAKSILTHYSWYNYKEMISNVIDLKRQLATYSQVLNERKKLLANYNLTANYNGTIIFVIGESETSSLMNDYGFFLKDTEYTNKRNDIIKYSDVVTTYPQTMVAVPDFLTLGDSTHNVSYSDTKSYDIMSVLKAVGIKSYWISTQERTAFFANPVSVVASSSDETKFLHELDAFKSHWAIDKYDESIIPYFKEVIKNSGNKIIFLHLMGNHANYADRYPKEFDKFHYSQFNEKKFYGKLEEHYDINDYINSIDYTDYVLKQIYDITDNMSENVAVLYHSDHGESPINHREHMGDNGSIYTQHFIPMYLHFNQKFIESYPELYKNATANVDKPYYTLYDPYSIFDLVGLHDKNGNTPDFLDRNKSIFNADYKASERVVKLTHTPDKYNKNNDYYENTHALMLALRKKYNDSNVTDNIYADDVSSLGKLIEAKPLFYGVSTNILLGDKNYGAKICDAKDDCSYNLTINEYLQACKGFLRKPDLHLLFFIENNSTIENNNSWIDNFKKAINDNKININNIRFVVYSTEIKSKLLHTLNISSFDNNVGVQIDKSTVNFGNGDKIILRTDINSSDENFPSLFPLKEHTSLIVSYQSMM